MKASTGVVIDRPIDEVFAFVAGVENMDRWVDGVTEPRRTSDGELGLGSTFASKYTWDTKTHDITYVVSAHDRPARYGVKSTSGPFPFELFLELESVGGGTWVTSTIDAGADSLATSVIFTLLGPVLRISMRKRLRKQLESLKAALESAQPAAAV